ncbi:predicted protein [Sclerotinia sclerotiorum 1980 UF-70]|uniref:Uncharacterized protein n=1 Tax=Sclerotinia sclerotiorum (strain ATCC 18683 / 1980 / Ss-1) TaxID=665079 RepID=A7EEU6_SCLS1|nr:predicted protein [Sclerotinia sclerotiorum 1980 UF-70]EDO01362.1 predicted protein [Sclerotinia sclerotiorum 1980 UF-70]
MHVNDGNDKLKSGGQSVLYTRRLIEGFSLVTWGEMTANCGSNFIDQAKTTENHDNKEHVCTGKAERSSVDTSIAREM